MWLVLPQMGIVVVGFALPRSHAMEHKIFNLLISGVLPTFSQKPNKE